MKWYPLAVAAALMATNECTMRRRLDRHKKVGADGVIEAEVDGLRGRKYGSRWKVLLGEGWSSAGGAS